MVEIGLLERQKRKVLEKLLEDDYILVQVNTGIAEVALPVHLMVLPSVTLKLSKLFRGTLTIHPDRIAADLLFNGAYFTCCIPFNSIWAASSARGTTHNWDDAAPASVKSEKTSGSMASPSPQSSSPSQAQEAATVMVQEVVAESAPKNISKSQSSKNSPLDDNSAEQDEKKKGEKEEVAVIRPALRRIK